MKTYPKILTVVLLIFTTLWASPFLSAAQTPAIYFQHEGDSDKPISPLVIAAEKPSDKELAEILGSEEWEVSLFFAVSSADLEKIKTVLKPHITSKDPEKPGYEFGTFKVTLVESGSSKSKIFPCTEFKKILGILHPIISEDYESLKEYFETLKRRLN